jgi:hypothetical protein
VGERIKVRGIVCYFNGTDGLTQFYRPLVWKVFWWFFAGMLIT